FPALRAGTSGDPGAGPAGQSARLAMGAEALREAGTAPQTGQRPEHLDLRSHRAAQVAAVARLSVDGAFGIVRGSPAGQPLPVPGAWLRVSSLHTGNAPADPMSCIVDPPHARWATQPLKVNAQ